MAREGFTKQPAETFPVGVNFSDRLLAGETILLDGSSIAEVPMIESPDEGDTVIVDGSLEVSSDGTTLSCRLAGGLVATNKYRLSFRAATSMSNLYEHDVMLTVID